MSTGDFTLITLEVVCDCHIGNWWKLCCFKYFIVNRSQQCGICMVLTFRASSNQYPPFTHRWSLVTTRATPLRFHATIGVQKCGYVWIVVSILSLIIQEHETSCGGQGPIYKNCWWDDQIFTGLLFQLQMHRVTYGIDRHRPKPSAQVILVRLLRWHGSIYCEGHFQEGKDAVSPSRITSVRRRLLKPTASHNEAALHLCLHSLRKNDGSTSTNRPTANRQVVNCKL